MKLARRVSSFVVSLFFLTSASLFAQWSQTGSSPVTTTYPVEINAGGGGSVDLKVTGRIRTGNGTLGGVWLNADQTMFVGQASTSSFGFYGGGAFRLVVERDSGYVGINTQGPLAPLDIHANATGTPRTVMRLADDSAYAQGVGPGLDFSGVYVNTGAYATFGNIRGVKANATNGYANGLLILSASQDNAQLVEVVRLAAGTMTVTGDATFTGTVTGGNIQAKYQDVAEWVPSTTDLAPGTVVVLNPQIANEVMASHKAYDTSVAGVVSAQPGLILGEAAANKEQIATTGRVKVRVDATEHPIAIGDLLVTSAKPGTAMYSSPVDLGGVKIHRPGTIIGKALEPLAAGEGEILVLLSMQ